MSAKPTFEMLSMLTITHNAYSTLSVITNKSTKLEPGFSFRTWEFSET
jgi:hypothetical protein